MKRVTWHVHGSVYRESMSLIVQQGANINSFIFLQRTRHVSVDTFNHHQEHTQTVITGSGTDRTDRYRPLLWRSRFDSTTTDGSDKVRSVPDAVITVCVCSWWWVKVSPETCRAVCRNIIKLYTVASSWTIIDTDITDIWQVTIQTCSETHLRLFVVSVVVHRMQPKWGTPSTRSH